MSHFIPYLVIELELRPNTYYQFKNNKYTIHTNYVSCHEQFNAVRVVTKFGELKSSNMFF